MRGYIYCSDVASAFDTIIHRGKIGTIYNVGSDFELCNLDLHEELCRQMQIANPEQVSHSNDVCTLFLLRFYLFYSKDVLWKTVCLMINVIILIPVVFEL